MNDRSIYLHGLAYELGEDVHSLDTLSESTSDDGILADYRREGLASYRTTRRPPAELACLSLQKTLAKTAVKPQSIDAVIYASDSYWNRAFLTEDVPKAMVELGLGTVPVIGVTLNGCSKLGAALRVATALISSGDCREVLLVSTERWAEDDSRLQLGFSVVSDSAASCLVNSDARAAQWELLGLTHMSCFSIHEETQQIRRWRSFTKSLKRASSRLFETISRSPDDVSLLVTHNYIETTRKSLAQTVGVPFDRAFADNVAANGYCMNSDVLINLCDAYEKRALPHGSLVFALSTGGMTATCMGLLASSTVR